MVWLALGRVRAGQAGACSWSKPGARNRKSKTSLVSISSWLCLLRTWGCGGRPGRQTGPRWPGQARSRSARPLFGSAVCARGGAGCSTWVDWEWACVLCEYTALCKCRLRLPSPRLQHLKQNGPGIVPRAVSGSMLAKLFNQFYQFIF